VKAAAQEVIKLVPAEFNAIKNSTSVAQFDKAIQAATSGAKGQNAASIIEAYESAQCGTS
jgi:hypothetical protein